MKLQLTSIIALFVFFHLQAVQAQNLSVNAMQALPRSSPESQGVSSKAIVEYLLTADREIVSMHSFMIVRHGKVIAEAWWKPESTEKPHVLWSLSKSFTSTAIGLAVQEDRLSIDDHVLKFFPDDAPDEISVNLKSMRVKDLLTMTTGHQNEVNLRNQSNWIKSFLAHPVPHKPGTHFQYNTPATFMLSAIIQKVTGQTVTEYLRPRLFEPLGIDQPQWDLNPQGIAIGGYGLYLKTEDIAKFGQLYLQKGNWQGKQIIPADWVDQATSKQVSNGSDPTKDWDQGYGFQFWRCRHNGFRGDGKDGQFCIVLPEVDTVIAITASTSNMQAALSLVWDKLLPGIQDNPLTADTESNERLKSVANQLKSAR